MGWRTAWPSRRSHCRRLRSGLSGMHIVEALPAVRDFLDQARADRDRLLADVDTAQPLVEASRRLVVAQDPHDHVAQAQLAQPAADALHQPAPAAATPRPLEPLYPLHLSSP